MSQAHPLRSIPDDELLRGLRQLLGQSRRLESDLLAHIAEVDERRLYAREASPSMFAYCTEVLHLSEHEAYLRITVARASREQPILLEGLRDGRLHLSGIAKLLPHLAPENREALLARAAHRSKREIEELVAELDPKPDAPARVRKLPAPHGPTPAATAPGATPLAPPAASPSGLEPRAEDELGPDRVVRTAVLTPPARPPVVAATTPSIRFASRAGPTTWPWRSATTAARSWTATGAPGRGRIRRSGGRQPQPGAGESRRRAPPRLARPQSVSRQLTEHCSRLGVTPAGREPCLTESARASGWTASGTSTIYRVPDDALAA